MRDYRGRLSFFDLPFLEHALFSASMTSDLGTATSPFVRLMSRSIGVAPAILIFMTSAFAHVAVADAMLRYASHGLLPVRASHVTRFPNTSDNASTKRRASFTPRLLKR
jgi:hypothetical protein